MQRGRESQKLERDWSTGEGARRRKEPALSVPRWKELSLCAPAVIKDKFKGLAPRWKQLALWWLTHALVGGVGRVIFEVSLPPVLRSARFGFSIDGVPQLLQFKSIGSVISKLACGPVLAVIGLKRAGCLSLLLVAANILCVGLPAGAAGGPLVPFAIAYVLHNVFQTATWPGTNLLLASWFPAEEHGTAWGIMGTAAKAGSIAVTLVLSVLDATGGNLPKIVPEPPAVGAARWWSRRRKAEETQPTLDDPADDVQLRFRAVAFIMCLWCLVLASYLRETPPTNPKTMHGEAQPPSARGKSPARRGRGSKSPHPAARSSHIVEANKAPKGAPPHPKGEGDRKDGNMSSFLRELRDTMTQPIFLLGLLVQTAITPIAEFQSQLPLLLDRDAQLTAADVNQGNSLWHAGVLVAVLVAGRVFDRLSPLARMALVGLPLLANAALFVLVSTSETLAGRAKLPLVFLLGATHGPANYLIYTNVISRRAPKAVMVTVSSLSEVVTLGVHVLLLHVQRQSGDAVGAAVNTAIGAGLVCLCATVALYVCEHRDLDGHSRRVPDSKSR